MFSVVEHVSNTGARTIQLIFINKLLTRKKSFFRFHNACSVVEHVSNPGAQTSQLIFKNKLLTREKSFFRQATLRRNYEENFGEVTRKVLQNGANYWSAFRHFVTCSLHRGEAELRTTCDTRQTQKKMKNFGKKKDCQNFRMSR